MRDVLLEESYRLRDPTPMQRRLQEGLSSLLLVALHSKIRAMSADAAARTQATARSGTQAAATEKTQAALLSRIHAAQLSSLLPAISSRFQMFASITPAARSTAALVAASSTSSSYAQQH